MALLWGRQLTLIYVRYYHEVMSSLSELFLPKPASLGSIFLEVLFSLQFSNTHLYSTLVSVSVSIEKCTLLYINWNPTT